MLFYKRSNHEVFSRRENKSQELSKVSSGVRSTTSESLTVPTMQQSLTKNYKIGHQSSKKKLM